MNLPGKIIMPGLDDVIAGTFDTLSFLMSDPTTTNKENSLLKNIAKTATDAICGPRFQDSIW